MELGLAGKKALVLGSSRGLGFGIATGLAKEGASVAICGRNQAKLAELAKNLSEKYRVLVVAITVDLSSDESEQHLADQVNKYFGEIDILVNNTGGPPMQDTRSISTVQWHTYFESMVLRIISITNLLIPPMIKNGWGRVLNIVSSGVLQPIPGLVLSNTLRSALIAWSKTLSAEVACHGVTVNSLAPGKIETERLAELSKVIAEKNSTSIEEVDRLSMEKIPLRRYGRVDEFAAAALFLLSEPASYITGSVIRVDGGMINSIY